MNGINLNQIITNAPYNTLNLPYDVQLDLSNPQIKSNTIDNVSKKSNIIKTKPLQRETFQTETNDTETNGLETNGSETNGLETNESENNFYDPTKQMVDDYLKTNISMYDNRGKYFDSYLFNRKFDEYIKQKTQERKLKEQVQLYDLDRIDNISIQPYQLPIDKLLINLKNVWFELFDNLIERKNPSYLFTTNNFFYFGITLIVIFILYIMLSYIFN
jgi:hypothetical protein